MGIIFFSVQTPDSETPRSPQKPANKKPQKRHKKPKNCGDFPDLSLKLLNLPREKNTKTTPTEVG